LRKKSDIAERKRRKLEEKSSGKKEKQAIKTDDGMRNGGERGYFWREVATNCSRKKKVANLSYEETPESFQKGGKKKKICST